jgi:hypothetical protein
MSHPTRSAQVERLFDDEPYVREHEADRPDEQKPAPPNVNPGQLRLFTIDRFGVVELLDGR